MIGDRGVCLVCKRETIRQCVICSRWICQAHREQCPCLYRYLVGTFSGVEIMHVMATRQPDATHPYAYEQIACGYDITAIPILRLDTAPVRGAYRCPDCFADSPPITDAGWGTEQALVEQPLALYDQGQRRGQPRKHKQFDRAASTPDDHIALDTHRVTPGAVLFDDAVAGLPIAEKRIADLLLAIDQASRALAAYSEQARTLDNPKHRQSAEGKANYCESHLVGIRAKLVEEQSAFNAYVAVLLAVDEA